MNSLANGIHVWWWPKRGWGDPARTIADLVSLGVRGVIPQASLFAPVWLEQHVHAIRAAGLQVFAGLGMDGAHTAPELAGAIKHGLDVADGVMLDWEKPKLWETTSGNALAAAIVDDVLASRTDVDGRIVDCPWWAPLFTVDSHGDHHATHPHAPTATMGRLAKLRFVQAYGKAQRDAQGQLLEPLRAANGRSSRMLAWARDPSQYPAIAARAGVAPWTVLPAFEGYDRTAADHVKSMTAEPIVCVWDLEELDADARLGLRAIAKLASLGFTGPDATRAYQKAAALTADNECGPLTLAALGIS